MRIALVAMLALTLAACDSGAVPTPSEAERGLANVPVSANDTIVDLRNDGLAAGPEAFYFAAGKSEVESAIARVLGEATGRSSNAECGAGPIDFTEFPGGLTVHFQQGRMVGWNWRAPQDGDAKPKGTIRLVTGDVAAGAPRSIAEQTPGFARITQNTLGEEFSLGPSVGGFFQGDTVAMLYAGTQCFFR